MARAWGIEETQQAGDSALEIAAIRRASSWLSSLAAER